MKGPAHTGVVDATVIGGGHNGLVCAFRLAEMGLRTVVIEEREILGGACVTTRRADGLGYSPGACWYGMLRPHIAKQLSLERYGLRSVAIDPQLCVLCEDGRHLLFRLSGPLTAESLAAVRGDEGVLEARALSRFGRHLGPLVDLLNTALLRAPVSSEQLDAAGYARGLKFSAADFLSSSIHTVLSRAGIHGRLAAALALPGVAITSSSPFQRGSAIGMLYMLCAETDGTKGAWGYAIGGMGAVTSALSAACMASGVSLRVSRRVDRVDFANGGGYTVTTSNGQRLWTRLVVSGADLHATEQFLRPVLPGNGRARNALVPNPTPGNAAAMHLILSDLPDPIRSANLSRDLICRAMFGVAHSLHTMHRAHTEAIAGHLPSQPIITGGFPTQYDRSLAPNGGEILSLFIQYVPMAPFVTARSRARASLVKLVFATLIKYFPNLLDVVRDYDLLDPLDIEERFGLTAGQPEHGDMLWHHMLDRRGAPNVSNYRWARAGIYHCSSAVHPGGTVTGAPGWLCADTVERDLATAGGIA